MILSTIIDILILLTTLSFQKDCLSDGNQTERHSDRRRHFKMSIGYLQGQLHTNR